MIKATCASPGEGPSPNTKWTLLIQIFVQCVEKCLVMNVKYIFQKIGSFCLLFRFFIKFLKLNRRQ